jgi:Rod binding domain-containing protein
VTTHPIQFGRPGEHAHSHAYTSSHPVKIGNHFAMTRPKSSGDKEHDALVKQTEKWVAQTFYGEMLKQMRNSPFKSKIFDGGEGGQAFTEMFDQQLADKMSKGAGKKLVDSIVNKIEAGKAYGHHASKTGAHHTAHHMRIKPQPMSPTLRAKIGALP